eukprot:TRINITY_DN5916_c0_g1_i2.p1 TRINITY_DN5916_c0_g1~~TRINITY_DN5916_c0_g1_i2.p1  ORF type:complete len:625 (-),score=134.06 TRINITY_DN5916_c0_g1_i2:155-2029(-)
MDERTQPVQNEAPNAPHIITALLVFHRTYALHTMFTLTQLLFFSRVGSGQSFSVMVRFTARENAAPFENAADVFTQRQHEADSFYDNVHGAGFDEDQKRVQRQAFAGLLWSKQFYHYNIELWLKGDDQQPPPPAERFAIRNSQWQHMNCLDVLSMPDKWEYPWFAAWDLAFHTLAIAQIDPEWAKRQLILLLREWYMHPNGQMAAYEWNFGDVNPPVHAWAALRVYQIDRANRGVEDTAFLERTFHKLLLNFTWWVNRKDAEGRNVFQGGFLGLDNIGVFDRSAPLPPGHSLDQADGTSWMAMYCLNMLAIALELASVLPAYEDVATKFFEHFIYIANASSSLWNDEEGFYFDYLHGPSVGHMPLTVFSFVGLIPLFAVETVSRETLDKLPNFTRRMEWFKQYRPHLTRNVASLDLNENGTMLLSVVRRDQLQRVVSRMLDESEFLSAFGLRSLSKRHAAQPYQLALDDWQGVSRIAYEPAESRGPMFGGNSNWRGPIWMPVNYLMVEALQKHHLYYGDALEVPLMKEGELYHMSLQKVATELAHRLCNIFLRDRRSGQRAVYGANQLLQRDEHWRDLVLFYEYFHGDSGEGLGASHQTGWTALIVNLLFKMRCRSCDMAGTSS